MDSPSSIMHFSIHGEERAFTFKIVFCRFMEVTLDYLFWMEQVRDSLSLCETIAPVRWDMFVVVNARGWRWTEWD